MGDPAGDEFNPYSAPGVDLGGRGETAAKPRDVRRAAFEALVQQAAVLIFTAGMLDGGRLLRCFAVAAAASWAASAVIVLRRPGAPTRTDLVMIRYGFWFILALTVALASLAGR